ncbi:hypothetical protein DXG01_005232 [Tephrocybe rancida]|nr:hypothetical protein DXG01_005232 [Tephrocybe rancida]
MFTPSTLPQRSWVPQPHRPPRPRALGPRRSDELSGKHTPPTAHTDALFMHLPPITEGNVFEEHLGDRRFYSAYLAFLESAVQQQVAAGAIETYVFRGQGGEGKGISMLDRSRGGLLHAITHVGYGLEFGLAGMVVEGLAQAAVHDDSVCAGISRTCSSFPGELAESQGKSVHIFTVLARVLRDPNLRTVGDPSEEGMFGWTMRNHSASIL